VHRWEARTGDQVGHIATQVGVHDLRASDAHHWTHLVFGQVADFENAALLALDQEHGLVGNFGVHGRGHTDLKNALGHGCGFHAQLDVHAGLLLVGESTMPESR